MSVVTVLYGTSASLLTGIAVHGVAGNHDPVGGSVIAAGAVACAIISINSCVRESFKATLKEVSKEIKPNEARSPVPETAPPELKS